MYMHIDTDTRKWKEAQWALAGGGKGKRNKFGNGQQNIITKIGGKSQTDKVN